MQESTPSRTAERVAVHRARHQLLDDPKIFVDPFALPILGEETAERLRREGPRGDDASSRAMRAQMVARSLHAEEALAHAAQRGVLQYLVLGAGLDTFAYRNPYPALRVFEVDHPATQAWKRERLRASGVTVPASTQFTPIDFDRESLTEALAGAGFEATQAAFVSWLGVTPYLEPSATYSTLRALAKLAPGSGVTFDYILDRDLLPAGERVRFEGLDARVSAAGEPFRGLFRPHELRADLFAMSFATVEDLDREALNERYLHSRADGLRVLGSSHLLTAWK